MKEKSTKKFGGNGKNAIHSLFFLSVIQKGIILPEQFKLTKKSKIFEKKKFFFLIFFFFFNETENLSKDQRNSLSNVSKTLKEILCSSKYENTHPQFYLSAQIKSDFIVELFSKPHNHPTKLKFGGIDKYKVSLNKICELFFQFEESIKDQIVKSEFVNKIDSLFSLEQLKSFRGKMKENLIIKNIKQVEKKHQSPLLRNSTSPFTKNSSNSAPQKRAISKIFN